MTNTTLPKLNTGMLDQILDIITKHPKRHEQGAWRTKLTGKLANLNGAPARECGTAMCVAGWAVELDRGQWAFPATAQYSDYLVARKAEIEAGVTESWASDLHPKPLVSVRTRAIRVLGLTDYEASELFSPGNTRRDIKAIVRRLKRDRGLL